MGSVGGSVAAGVTKTLNITSGSSSSSNSLRDACREGEDKQISISEEDKNILIDYVESVEVPATNSGATNILLNAGGKLFTGSKFVHQGLIFGVCSGDYYVCQTYPIQLVKCNDYNDALDKIKNNWAINKDVKNENLITTLYVSNDKFCLSCVKEVLENFPNKYNLFDYNCQHFCSNIIKKFRLKKQDIICRICIRQFQPICDNHKNK